MPVPPPLPLQCSTLSTFAQPELGPVDFVFNGQPYEGWAVAVLRACKVHLQPRVRNINLAARPPHKLAQFYVAYQPPTQV
ncbi:hypothetical protein JMJ77_0012935 [Colletotrichum scovillei]|uniref:Uncharacterized protein n=1 Tax=Colletotrichum scovillei TaxID=1209932 RepID=A0A9P7R6I7_9PEZI|nr:hypothetical protein JMJ77_0012935 [Colletotrichum scovillei]